MTTEGIRKEIKNKPGKKAIARNARERAGDSDWMENHAAKGNCIRVAVEILETIPEVVLCMIHVRNIKDSRV